MKCQNEWFRKTIYLLACNLVIAAPTAAHATEPGSARKVFGGDTHLHTSYSPDAFLMRNQS